MRYNIKDTSLASSLQKYYNLPVFCAKVLASYDKQIIKDLLTYQKQPVVFEQMEEAVELINKHIQNNSKIVIMGDYDCDGILATSILVKAFAKLDYEVGYYIPNRIKDGYGLNTDLVEQFIAKEYDLIITVDNGINAKDAIILALNNGIDVIVSDHHTQDETQKCDILYLHPAYSNLDYAVSGGFVAYHLASSLLSYEDDYFHALAAITLISDVMPLVKGNRLFIREALTNMNNKHYLQIDCLADGFIDSSMIGTKIAPKINSLGRLPDIYNPNHLVRYFCSNNRLNIINYAKEIEECNNVRKQLSNDYYLKYGESEVKDNFLMIEDTDIHEGIIGLLASRFTNQYQCLSFIASIDDEVGKASIRSIPELDAYELLMKHQDLFTKIGGHSQALGLSYDLTNSQKIKEMISTELKDFNFKERSYDVVAINEEDINLDNIQSLRYLEPFGNGFQKPFFLLRNVIVASIKPLKGNLHHRLTLLDNNDTIEAMLFNSSNLELKVNDSVDVIVNLGINEYNNRVKESVIIEDYQIL